MKITINKKNTPKENITTVDENGIEWVTVSSTQTVHDEFGNLIAGESVRYSTTLSPEEEAVLRERAKSDNMSIRVGVAENIGCPADLLVELSDDDYRWVRAKVADNINTPVDTLVKLSTDEDYNVRKNVAYNPNTPYEVLKAMKKAEKGYADYKESDGAVFRNLSYNDNFRRKPKKHSKQTEYDLGSDESGEVSEEFIEKFIASRDDILKQMKSDFSSNKKFLVKTRIIRVLTILRLITEILIIPLIIFGFVTGSWMPIIFDVVAWIGLYVIKRVLRRSIVKEASSAFVGQMADRGLITEDARDGFEEDLLRRIAERGLYE